MPSENLENLINALGVFRSFTVHVIQPVVSD